MTTTFINSIVWADDLGKVRFDPVREEGRLQDTQGNFLETQEEHYARAAQGQITRGRRKASQPWFLVANASLSNRRWRNAWRISGNSLVTDLVAAREIRKRELLQLQHDYVSLLRERALKANELGDAQAEKAAKDKLKKVYAVDLDAELAGVSDLAILDKFVPADLKD